MVLAARTHRSWILQIKNQKMHLKKMLHSSTLINMAELQTGQKTPSRSICLSLQVNIENKERKILQNTIPVYTLNSRCESIYHVCIFDEHQIQPTTSPLSPCGHTHLLPPRLKKISDVLETTR